MLNIRHRSRLIGLVAICAAGLSLSGCVAYGDGGSGYAGGYGGGYGGGYYGGSSVNVYAPRYNNAGYRHGGDHHRYQGHGSYEHRGSNNGGYHNGGNNTHGGNRPEANNRRPDHRQSYGG